ncbi:hypothetical protein JB92DRAFT_3141249 [Gautieria morchelliformis]|nr:hypothetical protein JB92DRAFT_3141249 [Gautieria morchelliformis]
MRPATIAKWLEENANAPPPPATPAGLPDDTVSTVYPESSVSNPYASRYTGTRHRSVPFARGTHPQPTYLERRPLSAQAHHRDRQPTYVAPPSRPRHNSFSDSRYIPSQPQPFAYSYAQPRATQTYYMPSSTHPARNNSTSRASPHRVQSTPQYRVVSTSPNRADASRSHDSRHYGSHDAYHSTPTITLQPRAPSTKKQPFLRRIFGLDWRTTPTKSSSQHPRDTSRSSYKSNSKSHSRSLDRESGYRPSRGRSHSDGVVYVRY